MELKLEDLTKDELILLIRQLSVLGPSQRDMNRTGKPKGSAKGVAEFPIKITAPIPASGEPDWWTMKDAKITIEPLDTTAQPVTYSGFCVEEVGSKYVMDGEAKRDISGFALNRVGE